MRDTLLTARHLLERRVALAHLDPATGDGAASRALAVDLAPLITPLLRPDGILVSEPAIAWDGLSRVALPNSVAPGRYNLYRYVSCQSSA
jgi:hypothetical protein